MGPMGSPSMPSLAGTRKRSYDVPACTSLAGQSCSSSVTVSLVRFAMP